MYPLFETLCLLEGQIRHAEWHERRFAHSYFREFGRLPSFSLLEGVCIPEEFQKGKNRLRILYNSEGTKAEIEPYQTAPLNRLRLIEAPEIDYSLKWRDRSALDQLKQQRGDADDVLILQHGAIRDTSYCNVVFFDGKDWLTPATPLLEGTARARLIAEGKIVPQELTLSDLPKMQGFRLINALREFEEEETRGMENLVF
ncbi:aminotransferase class IV [Algoriphagus taiwanensis]|uniref:Aminotransferase class IV family protein n=1 Tax=Algoriphagus taiwanensis TaxID=1445656 RepID=A0ABQ6PV40_9BACT|nr:aminotransferase class IV family protein [Algoriphagus taiwanensis]